MISTEGLGKINKSFYIVGLDSKQIIQYNNEEEDSSNLKFVQNIDIIYKRFDNLKNLDVIEPNKKNEKWLRIMKNHDIWLRLEYTQEYYNPITDFKIVPVEYAAMGEDERSANKQKYLLVPNKFKAQGFRAIKALNLDNINQIQQVNEENKIEHNYNEFFYLVPSYCDVKDYLQLNTKESGAVFLISRLKNELPIKEIKIQISNDKGNYKIALSKHKSPYIYKYLPNILDVYPVNEEEKRNQDLANFCFPEGIQILQEYKMPKLHNFVLTNEYKVKFYGTCLIFLEEISDELANSFVPNQQTKNKFFIEKAICILCNYPFLYNSKIFLREIYRMQVSSGSNIPLERVICHYIDALFIESYDKTLSFYIGEEELKFYLTPIYGNYLDINDDSIQILFSFVSIENIITVWEGLLLDKKIFILCSCKSILTHICLALISLLFPFEWMGCFVPLLPEKTKKFIATPFPLIMGISFPLLDINNNIPSDSLILNVDKNCFENYIDKLPKLPKHLSNPLTTKLNKFKSKCKLQEPDLNLFEEKAKSLEEVFKTEDVELINNELFDSNVVRDIFYEFFINMFSHFEKYFNWKQYKKQLEESDPKAELIFSKEAFLKDHNSTEEGTFLYKFIETNSFAQFVDSFKYYEQNSSTGFFLESIKKGKDKHKHYLPRNAPSISVVIPDIPTENLNNKKFIYKTFPNEFNKSLFIKVETVKKTNKPKFIFTRDEWCYDVQKLNNKDWAKYLMYIIYEIWYNFFCFVLRFYDNDKANVLMRYGLDLCTDLITKKKINPSRNLFTKLIKCCGSKTCLNSYVQDVLNLVKLGTKSVSHSNFYAAFQSAFINNLYDVSEEKNVKMSSMVSQIKESNILNPDSQQLNDFIKKDINSTIFLTHDYCPNCLKFKKNPKKIIIEEILGGFSKSKSDYSSLCPSCLNKIFPKIYMIKRDQTTLDTKNVGFMSPLVLLKEVESIIKSKTEKYFYDENFYNNNYHKDIFWNLIYYFSIFDLPLCVLYVENDPKKFQEIELELENKTYRRSNYKKRNNQKGLINKSADINTKEISNRIPTVDKSDTESAYTPYETKKSNASNDCSVISGKSGKSTMTSTESAIWDIIKEKLKKTAKNKTQEKNTNEDRGEINGKIYEIKAFLSKIIENFIYESKGKIDVFLNLSGVDDKSPATGLSSRSGNKSKSDDKSDNSADKELNSNIDMGKNLAMTEIKPSHVPNINNTEMLNSNLRKKDDGQVKSFKIESNKAEGEHDFQEKNKISGSMNVNANNARPHDSKNIEFSSYNQGQNSNKLNDMNININNTKLNSDFQNNSLSRTNIVKNNDQERLMNNNNSHVGGFNRDANEKYRPQENQQRVNQANQINQISNDNYAMSQSYQIGNRKYKTNLMNDNNSGNQERKFNFNQGNQDINNINNINNANNNIMQNRTNLLKYNNMQNPNSKIIGNNTADPNRLIQRQILHQQHAQSNSNNDNMNIHGGSQQGKTLYKVRNINMKSKMNENDQ